MDAFNHRPISIICGPTGSGKTAAAVELANSHPVQIVSADSRQIIRHLDIGTAKPTPEEQRQVRFHLLDLIEPGEKYSAYKFISDADRAIDDIITENYLPVVAGGTGLYLRALTDGVVEIEQNSETVRRQLKEEMEIEGCDVMYKKLKEIDPEEAARIHPHNKIRVIRALEIYRVTGTPKSKLVKEGAYKNSKYSYCYYCLAPPREELYQDINDRVDRMIAGGLVEEVRALVERGLKENIIRANVIGYNELIEYLSGNLLLSEAVDIIKQNSRRYAKRQMTWFRGLAACRFFPNVRELLQFVKSHCIKGFD